MDEHFTQSQRLESSSLQRFRKQAVGVNEGAQAQMERRSLSSQAFSAPHHPASDSQAGHWASWPAHSFDVMAGYLLSTWACHGIANSWVRSQLRGFPCATCRADLAGRSTGWVARPQYWQSYALAKMTRLR